MGEMTFDDYNSRIYIGTLLEDIGYSLDKKEGAAYPVYVRVGSDGHRVKGDKFIVTKNRLCCYQPPEHGCYTPTTLIDKRPELFAEYKPGMKRGALVHKVCRRLLNMPEQERKTAEYQKATPAYDFKLDNYQITGFGETFEQHKKFYPYFYHRGIDLRTQLDFAKHFVIESFKNRPDGKVIENLGFPFKRPADLSKVVGFEERGRRRMDGSTFKGKAASTDSSTAMWLANLTDKPLSEVAHVKWFESAYDAMAYHQLRRMQNRPFEPALYVSTGGNPSQFQIQALLKETPNAVHHLCFDKDMAGERFACDFAWTKEGRNYTSRTNKDGTIVYLQSGEHAATYTFDSKQFSYDDFCLKTGVKDKLMVREGAVGSYKDWNEWLLDAQGYKQKTPISPQKEEQKSQTVNQSGFSR